MRRLSTVAFLLACAVGMSRAHRGCMSYNGWFYDLSSDNSITTLDRYQGSTFVDRNNYAPFHLPAAGTTTWDEGVAFAATMQTRNAWLNNEQTSAATWVVNGGSTVWRWSTTVNGAPVQFTFTTEACSPPPATTTTAAPTPTPTPTPAPFSSRVCISFNGWFYDLRSSAAGTTFDRYQGTSFVDRNNYAAFNRPAPGTSVWDEGVAFAAAMQVRNVWLNTRQTTAAAWVNNGANSDTMTWWTTNNAGQPIQYIFTTAACSPPPATTTAAPTAAPTTTAAPTPAAGSHRGCMSYNGWFYDLRSNAAGTTFDRYQGATFMDRNNYAAFHLPAPGTTTWDEGVAFAATMQTRNVWLNTAQTSAATWVVNGAGDVWTWSTTVNGQPVQFTFTTAACL